MGTAHVHLFVVYEKPFMILPNIGKHTITVSNITPSLRLRYFFLCINNTINAITHIEATPM